MQFTQTFSVPFAREAVWKAFQDLEAIAGCMPGAQLTGPPKDGHLEGQVSVKLGPITAAFAGQGDVRFDGSAYTGEISGAGTDRKSSSRAKGTARFALAEAEGGKATTVKVDVDYQLSGALAQFSRANIVQDLASRLTQTFAENLKARLSALQPAAPAPEMPGEAPVAATAAPSPPPPSSPPPSLDLGSLLWQALRGWLRRLFGGRP
jgi:carbon monoxide dehydrogenase subunit G